MAVLRAALCLVLVFSMSKLIIAYELTMNQTVMEAIKQNNLTAVFETKNPECEVSILEIVQALTNTTNYLNGTAKALSISLDLLKSGCLAFTPLEIAGIVAKPPQEFLQTTTLNSVVKQPCEKQYAVATNTQIGIVLHSLEKEEVAINVTVVALVAQRRRETNETGSFTVIELLQTALNVTERELIESGLLNVSSSHLGFLNHTLDQLACIVDVPKEKVSSNCCVRFAHTGYIHTYIHTHTYMHTHIHTYIHTYTHTYIHACIHTYIHTYIHTHIHTYIHAYTHTYIHTYIHTYTHTYIHACIHTYIHTHIHTYIHTYIHAYIHTYIVSLCFDFSVVQCSIHKK